MKTILTPQVLVAGAGPVGLFSALTLKRHGIDVAVVDKGDDTAVRSYALALHPATLDLLQDMELADVVLASSQILRRVGLYDEREKRAEIDLGKCPGAHPYLAVALQSRIEELLRNELAACHVPIEWRHALADVADGEDGVHGTVNEMILDVVGYIVPHTEWVVGRKIDFDSRFLLAADGYSSLARRQLRIGFPEVGPTQQFAVFEFRTDAALDEEVRLVLTPDSTNVLWPLGNGYCRWSFELTDDLQVSTHSRDKEREYFTYEGRQHYPMLTDQQLRDFLKRRAPWFEGSIDDLRWRVLVRFERRLAERFTHGRVCLAGDAAHLTGPAGVQSMNAGLREGHRLADVIDQSLKSSTGDDPLAQAGKELRDAWLLLHGLKGQLRPSGDCDPWLADNASRILPCLPGTTAAELSPMLAQLNLKLAG